MEKFNINGSLLKMDRIQISNPFIKAIWTYNNIRLDWNFVPWKIQTLLKTYLLNDFMKFLGINDDEHKVE